MGENGSARKIDDILGDALGELYDREAKLEGLIEPAKEELARVRKAVTVIEKAQGKAKQPKRAPANGDGRTTAAEKRQRIKEALDRNLDGEPWTKEQIAKEAGVPLTGLHFLLAHMKRDSEVAEPEEGRFLSTAHARFDTSRRVAGEPGERKPVPDDEKVAAVLDD